MGGGAGWGCGGVWKRCVWRGWWVLGGVRLRGCGGRRGRGGRGQKGWGGGV